MRRELGLIGGASAVAIAAVIFTQAGLVSRPAETAPAEVEPGPEAPPVPEPAVGEVAPKLDPVPALRAEIDGLREELALRQAELGELTAAETEREDAIAGLTEALAARDAEIDDLRQQIAQLERLLAFDLKLAAMKAGDAPAPDVAQEDGPVVIDAATEDVLAAEAAVAAAVAAAEQELTEVHFEMGSADLTPGGRSRAAVAAVMLGDMNLAGIRLMGYTDRVGSPERNQALAAARAGAVADFLISAGLPPELIETAPMGETDLPVATGDGVSEPLNRCVAIVAILRDA